MRRAEPPGQSQPRYSPWYDLFALKGSKDRSASGLKLGNQRDKEQSEGEFYRHQMKAGNERCLFLVS